MTIVGRLTKDATVNVLKDERKVVNFSIAVNDHYTSKGEKVKVTSFFNCAYWINEGIAAYLKKGALVQVECRVFATAFLGADGEAKASLNCHVNNVKIHGGPKEAELIEKSDEGITGGKDTADDLPF